MTSPAPAPAPAPGAAPTRLSRASRLVRGLFFAFLAYALILATVPIVPKMPSYGADESWRLGINRAAARQLVFGEDILFTYGPLAGVATQWYEPGMRLVVLAAACAYALSWLAAAGLALARKPWWVVGFYGAAAFADIGFSNVDALLLVHPLVVLIAVRELAKGRVLARAPTWMRWALLAVMAAPLGLGVLIKLSSVPGSALATVVAMFLLWRAGDRIGAAVVPVAAFVTMQVAWIVVGQPPFGWWAYMVQSAPIVSGYTEAMSVAEFSRWPFGLPTKLFLSLVVALVLLALVRSRRDPEQLAVTAMVAGILFLTAKAAFVRADYPHLQLAVPTLLVAGPFVASTISHRALKFVVAFQSLVVAWVLYDSALPPNVPQPMAAVRANIVDLPREILYGELTRARLDEKYWEAMEAMRGASTIPDDLTGTVDVYPYMIVDVLVASGEWTPRPVIQSYSAYTRELAERNAEHLTGRDAPETVFLRVTPIDNRLAALDDGHSWRVLLEQYQLVDTSTGWLRLERRPTPQRLPVGQEGTIEAELGETIELPETTSGWLASFEVSPTVLGRAANLLWRPPPVEITVRTHDNPAGVVHRFVPAMAEAEFILSPYVATGDDMIALFDDPDALLEARGVTSVSVKVSGPGGAGFWSEHFSLRLRPIDLG